MRRRYAAILVAGVAYAVAETPSNCITILPSSNRLSKNSYTTIDMPLANKIIEDFVSIVSRWREVADRVGIRASEQERMENAFRLAG